MWGAILPEIMFFNYPKEIVSLGSEKQELPRLCAELSLP
jgi:hypothetical protein